MIYIYNAVRLKLRLAVGSLAFVFLAVAMRMQSIIKEWDESVGGDVRR